jgi:hypothetical protein
MNVRQRQKWQGKRRGRMIREAGCKEKVIIVSR